MEFIKRRPGGRVTVKPKLYDADVLSLGRATNCDVYLPDLRVGLHHARLQRLNDNRVRLETDEDHRMRVNGALTRRRDVHVGAGADIRIGPYQLTLTEAETPGDLLVTVELVEASTAVGEATDEHEVFSMKGYAPDRRVSAWTFMTFVFAAFLVLPVAAYFMNAGAGPRDTQEPSQIATIGNLSWISGEMSSAHANLVGNCRDCHENAFERVRDETCLTCHDDLRNHAHMDVLSASRPTHEGAGVWLATVREGLSIPEGRCGSCHFEHNGPEGVTPSSSGFCVECHQDMDKRLSDTELVNVADFPRRHPEFKPQIVTEPHPVAPIFTRISLVDRPKESNGLIFPHEFHLKDPEVARKVETLGGDAQRRWGDELECADCHRLDAAGALFQPIEMESECQDCHSLAFAAEPDAPVRSLPHGEPEEVKRVLEDFYLAQATAQLLGDNWRDTLSRQLTADDRARRQRLRDEAFENAQTRARMMINRLFSEDGACQKCHIVKAQVDPEEPPEIVPVRLTNRYLPKAVFPHAPHESGDLDCGTCHRAEDSKESSDVLLPGRMICAECHNDDRGGAAIASDCQTCHIYHDDDAAPFMTPAGRSAFLLRRTTP
ncbi:MAG: cytochrome c3 family protein [Pseudomonadota bacterium]